jgi:hypothetical protein
MSQTQSGFNIAHTWFDSWKGTGHPNFDNCYTDDSWPEPGSAYVWCNTFLDYDYEWSALLRVSTVAHVPKHFEVVDMLAVVDITGKMNVEWWNNPRLSHDEDANWLEDARFWFLELDHGLRRDTDRQHLTKMYGVDGAEEARRERAQHRRKQRHAARDVGLQLPYMNRTDQICRHCGTALHLVEGTDWIDDIDSDICPFGGSMTIVTRHEPQRAS